MNDKQPSLQRDFDFPLADSFPRPPQADFKEIDLSRPAPSTLRRRSKLTDMPVELGPDPTFATRCFGNLLLAMALVGALVAAGLVSPIRFDWGPSGPGYPGGSRQDSATP